MLRSPAALLFLLLAACPPSTREAALPDDGGADAGSTDTCALDLDCPRGMVCEACPAGGKSCVPGCRTDDQCSGLQKCLGPVTCTTCPCPPGWCELDPCRDVDGDGYVPTDDPADVCPGKLKGDCQDGNENIHPGAREVCNNWEDDDCDGKQDRASPSCRACISGEWSCRGPFECQVGIKACDRGCCTPCPLYGPPLCQPGECILPAGTGEDGCALPAHCGPCDTCAPGGPSVCGTGFATFENACHAAAAGQGVLHEGPCEKGEGVSCEGSSHGSAWLCGYGSLYCRVPGRRLDGGVGNPVDGGAWPPGLDAPRCLKVGTCLEDRDCRPGAVTSTWCADGGTPAFTCVDHACVSSCGGTK